MARRRALNDFQVRELKELAAASPHLSTRELAGLLGTSQATVIRRLRRLARGRPARRIEAAAGPPPHGPRPIVLPIGAAPGYLEATGSSRDGTGGRASLGSVVDEGGHLVAVVARHRRVGERGWTLTMDDRIGLDEVRLGSARVGRRSRQRGL